MIITMHIITNITDTGDMSDNAFMRILVKGNAVVTEEAAKVFAKEGIYLLNAAPINLGGSDGAPCRAILMSI